MSECKKSKKSRKSKKSTNPSKKRLDLDQMLEYKKSKKTKKSVNPSEKQSDVEQALECNKSEKSKKSTNPSKKQSDPNKEKEKIVEERRFKREGFHRQNVDWPRIVDNLLLNKKLQVKHTDSEIGDARVITKLCGKKVNILLNQLGNNPLNKDYSQAERTMLELHQTMCHSIPLIAYLPMRCCEAE